VFEVKRSLRSRVLTGSILIAAGEAASARRVTTRRVSTGVGVFTNCFMRSSTSRSNFPHVRSDANAADDADDADDRRERDTAAAEAVESDRGDEARGALAVEVE
jgi:hypothetical protein